MRKLEPELESTEVGHEPEESGLSLAESQSAGLGNIEGIVVQRRPVEGDLERESSHNGQTSLDTREVWQLSRGEAKSILRDIQRVATAAEGRVKDWEPKHPGASLYGERDVLTNMEIALVRASRPTKEQKAQIKAQKIKIKEIENDQNRIQEKALEKAYERALALTSTFPRYYRRSDCAPFMLETRAYEKLIDHKNEVFRAFDERLSVPPEVLRDYAKDFGLSQLALERYQAEGYLGLERPDPSPEQIVTPPEKAVALKPNTLPSVEQQQALIEASNKLPISKEVIETQVALQVPAKEENRIEAKAIKPDDLDLKPDEKAKRPLSANEVEQKTSVAPVAALKAVSGPFLTSAEKLSVPLHDLSPTPTVQQVAYLASKPRSRHAFDYEKKERDAAPTLPSLSAEKYSDMRLWYSEKITKVYVRKGTEDWLNLVRQTKDAYPPREGQIWREQYNPRLAPRFDRDAITRAFFSKNLSVDAFINQHIREVSRFIRPEANITMRSFYPIGRLDGKTFGLFVSSTKDSGKLAVSPLIFDSSKPWLSMTTDGVLFSHRGVEITSIIDRYAGMDALMKEHKHYRDQILSPGVNHGSHWYEVSLERESLKKEKVEFLLEWHFKEPLRARSHCQELLREYEINQLENTRKEIFRDRELDV